MSARTTWHRVAGPAPPGAQIEQPRPGPEPKLAREYVGLGHSGVPVGTPVAADDGQLDPAGHLGGGDPVPLGEMLGGLPLSLGHL
jgi:hypothetical protein